MVARTEGVAGRVVEVGCWEGRSTVVLANAVAPDVVHAVDTWRGSPGEISASLAQERDVFAQFTENIAALTAGNVAPHRTGWRTYFTSDTSPIRFLHIDAEHSYDEVRDNIETAKPLIAPGGIIAGDDAHHEPVMRAVHEQFVGEVIRFHASLWAWTKEV